MANKVIIGITDWEQTKTELQELAQKIDAGKKLPEADYHLNFSSAAQLFSELTPRRMELLEELKNSGASSINALSKVLHRNYSNVHGDVTKLIDLGLVTKDDDGRVFVPWKEIRINISLAKAA
jgi:predicted transcriptional regulator